MENENIQQTPQQPVTNPFPIQESVPNATTVLVLGIISLVVWCICAGVFSLALGIIALVLASKSNSMYNLNPEKYTLSSYKNLKAGKTCSIIGLALGGVILVIYIIYFVILGAAFTAIPWQMYQ